MSLTLAYLFHGIFFFAVSLCLLSASLIFDQFCDIKDMCSCCLGIYLKCDIKDMCSCCLGVCLKCLKFTIFQSWCYSLIHYMLIWIYSWRMHGFGNDLEICFIFVLILFQDLFLSLCLWILIWWTCVLYNISKLFELSFTVIDSNPIAVDSNPCWF